MQCQPLILFLDSLIINRLDEHVGAGLLLAIVLQAYLAPPDIYISAPSALGPEKFCHTFYIALGGPSTLFNKKITKRKSL